MAVCSWCKSARRLAQSGVLGIDHHAVEEGIDRRLQRGQGLERAGVVVLLEEPVGLGCHLAQRGGSGLLGGLLQQRVAAVVGRSPSTF